MTAGKPSKGTAPGAFFLRGVLPQAPAFRVKVLPMQGLHLTADLSQCRCDIAWLTDANRLVKHCLRSVASAGLQAVTQVFHIFAPSADGPGGVTATVLLAQSHLWFHTWPELRAATLDVYVCNFGGDHSAKARKLLNDLLQQFKPERVEFNTLHRGTAAALADRAPFAANDESTTSDQRPL